MRTAEAENDRELLLSRSLAAKVFCSEGDWTVSDVALQLFGGLGYIEESGVPMLLRDARITRIFEGANDVLMVHLGTIEAMTTKPAAGDDAIAQDVQAVRDRLRDTHGIRVLERQRELHRLGRLAMLREVSAAVRAHASGPAAEHWLALARARADALLRPIPSVETIEAVTGPLYERVRP